MWRAPEICEAEKFLEAGNALKKMVERYIAPKDNSIFQKLLICQCKSGDLDAAADVLKAMIRLSIPTEAGHYGILIENFCKANAYDRCHTRPLTCKKSFHDLLAKIWSRHQVFKGKLGKPI